MTDPSASSHRAAFLLSQIGAYVSARFAERVQGIGITPSEAGVLRFVARHPGTSQRSLADRLGSAPSRIVALADALESRGLIERRRSTVDRRNQELRLTSAGERILAQLGQIAQEHEREIIGALSDEETARLVALLQTIATDRSLDQEMHVSTRAR